MKARSVVLAMVLVLGVASFDGACAAPRGGFGGEMCGKEPMLGILLRAVNPLDFSDAQWEKAEAIVRATSEANRPLHDKLFGRHDEMRKIVEKGSFDEAAVRDVVAKGRPDVETFVANLERGAKDFFSMLSPEQQERLDGILAFLRAKYEDGTIDPAGRMLCFAARGLDLSTEQRSAAEKIVEETKAVVKPNVLKVLDILREQREALRAGKLDEGGIGESSARIAEVVGEIVVQKTRAICALRALLTPEQLEKAGHFHETMRHMRHGFGK